MNKQVFDVNDSKNIIRNYNLIYNKKVSFDKISRFASKRNVTNDKILRAISRKLQNDGYKIGEAVVQFEYDIYEGTRKTHMTSGNIDIPNFEYYGVINDDIIQDTLEMWFNHITQDKSPYYDLIEGFDIINDITPIRKIRNSKTIEKTQDILEGLMDFNLQPMKDDNPVKYYNIGSNDLLTYNNTNGSCVITHMKKIWPKIQHKIDAYFHRCGNNDDQGINNSQIIEFCKKYKLRLTIFDIFMNMTYNSNIYYKCSKHYKSLSYISANNHLYPINRKYIFNANKNSMNKFTINKKTQKKEYTYKLIDFNNTTWDDIYNEVSKDIIDVEHYYINVNCLSELFKLFIIRDNTIYKTTQINRNIVKIEKTGVYIHARIECFNEEAICHKSKINYEGQSIASIAKGIYNIKSHSDIPINKYHRFTHIPKGVYDKSIINKIHDENYRKSIKSYDITKCYSSCLVDNNLNYPIFTNFDYIEKYDGSDIICGEYFIETDKVIPPFFGSDWYNYYIVRKFIENNMISKKDIKYKRIAQNTIDYINIKNTTNEIYNKYGYTLGKKIVNIFVGSLNSSTTTSSICSYITKKEALRYYSSIGYKCFEIKLKGSMNNIYEIRKNRKNYFIKNNYPIYRQIIDIANWKMYELTKSIGGKILRFKTDHVICYGGNDVDTGNDLGSYRHEKIPDKGWKYHNNTEFMINHTKFENPKHNPLYIEHNSNKWNNIKISDVQHNNKSVLITGLAGTGKTYNVNKIIESMKDKKILKMSPTNCGALLINGSTIHKSLGIDIEGNQRHNIIKQMKLYDIIIIDEVSMITADIWAILIYIKIHCDWLKFILCGDFKQCKPVENYTYDYFNHYNIKYICDFNIITLTENKRGDDKLFSYFNNIDKNKIINDFGNEKHIVNIAYTNRTCCFINHIIMLQSIKNNKYIKIGMPDDPDNNKMAQIKYIYKSLPLIANKSMFIDNTTIYKNQYFNVVRFNKRLKLITIKLTDCDDGLITTTVDTIRNNFNVAYCVTVHKTQGRTINVKYSIWDSHIMPSDVLYTAISRGTKFDNINTHKFFIGYNNGAHEIFNTLKGRTP